MSKGASSKLADTTFNTKPDNKLAVVDVYENGGSGVENSFQDAYHKAGSDVSKFASIGKTALGGVQSAIQGATGAMSNVNRILQGIKSGNLNSLMALTGGTIPGLKQLSDTINNVRSLVGKATGVVNQAKNAVRAADQMGNGLKGGSNNNSILNRMVGNNPLSHQIKGLIRDVGSLKKNATTMEGTFGRASGVLGGDRSSMNTVVYGSRNKASDVAKPVGRDRPLAPEETEILLSKISEVNPSVASAIAELPKETQNALVRGFNTESFGKGMLAGNAQGVSALNPQASPSVVNPLNRIIDSVGGRESGSVQVQDTEAVSMLISGVTNIASKAGMKNTFSTLTQRVENTDVVVAAAKPLVIRAIEEGDLDMLIDLSQSKAAPELKNFAPSLIAETCYAVLRPEGMSQQEFPSYYKDVKTAFQRIDKDWSTYHCQSGKKLINGASIASNPFLCDLIESVLNDNKNEHSMSGTLGNQGKQPGTKLVNTTFEEPIDSFASNLEREIDQLNKDSYQQFIDNGETFVDALDKEEEPPAPTPQGPSAQTLTYVHEPFLLLASVFIDNSVESEMEKHFPYLHERFMAMGTYNH